MRSIRPSGSGIGQPSLPCSSLVPGCSLLLLLLLLLGCAALSFGGPCREDAGWRVLRPCVAIGLCVGVGVAKC